MIEITGNIFSEKLLKSINPSFICITTNGVVKKDGTAVMGAGVAKTARELIKGIDKQLGDSIKKNGNNVCAVSSYLNYGVVSFPVKYNFYEIADLSLIERSTIQLVHLISSNSIKVILPRPGCNNGKRDWEKEVKPILRKYLDDRFYIIRRY